MTRTMPALIGIALLGAWLGAAILVAAVVAPSAFAVLPSRALAGALVGRVLPVIFWSGMAVGLGVIGLARVHGWHKPSVVGGLVALVSCAIAQLVIAPRIERIRSAITGPVDALPMDDPLRVDFGRLHGLSVLAMGIGALGVLVALVAIMRLSAARNIP
jgi:hypothetical protein